MSINEITDKIGLNVNDRKLNIKKIPLYTNKARLNINNQD